MKRKHCSCKKRCLLGYGADPYLNPFGLVLRKVLNAPLKGIKKLQKMTGSGHGNEVIGQTLQLINQLARTKRTKKKKTRQ